MMETEQRAARTTDAYKKTVSKSKGEGLVRPRKQKHPARLKKPEDDADGSVTKPLGRNESGGADAKSRVPKLTYGKQV